MNDFKKLSYLIILITIIVILIIIREKVNDSCTEPELTNYKILGKYYNKWIKTKW